MGVQQRSSMGLPDLRKRMAGITSTGFRVRMAKNLAEEARHQIDDGFQQQRDPYGKKWAPIQRKGMILQKTGRMAASVATKATAEGFRIDIPVVYAAPHQYGVAPHARKGGAIPVNARGRFASKRKLANGRVIEASSRARSQRVRLFGAYTHGGLPQRQMIPMNSTGGLGPIWTSAFNAVANKLLADYARGVQ